MAGPAQPLTVRELGVAIDALLAERPHAADWHVHVLDMEPDNNAYEEEGLVTHIETDCFDAEQGTVLSLLAWSNRPIARNSNS